MEKIVLAAASYTEQKYFLEKEFASLPESNKEEVRASCVVLAQKLGCTFLMGFTEDGTLYFETIKREDDFDFDDIGAELEIKRLQREQKELLKALELWYAIYFTEEGEKVKAELLKQAEENQMMS